MAAHPRPAGALGCMELWGGNQATDRAVSTPGLDIRVYSRPHEQAAAGGDVHYVSVCGGGVTTRLILAFVRAKATFDRELGAFTGEPARRSG